MNSASAWELTLSALDVVESCCSHAELWLTLKDTLQAYPGCVHWHYKYGNQPGTLEITLWPAQSRIWFKVARGHYDEPT